MANDKYSVVFDDVDACDYESIAKHVTGVGFQMTIPLARSTFFSAMQKLSRCVLEHNGIYPTQAKIEQLAKNPSFHKAIGEYMHITHYTHKKLLPDNGSKK
jgi:hypothetical protein